MKNKTLTTSQAAEKLGIGFRTLTRWLNNGVIRPQGIPYGGGRFLWVWTKADLDRAKEIMATLKPGRKPKVKNK